MLRAPALYEDEDLDAPATSRTAVELPRTGSVALDALLPGDLVFFHMHAHGIDHVGIYVGDGRFVHAPRAVLGRDGR